MTFIALKINCGCFFVIGSLSARVTSIHVIFHNNRQLTDVTRLNFFEVARAAFFSKY